MTNATCDILGIAVPSLEGVKGHPQANTYALLIVALLERGEAMTLAAVAQRFEETGIAPGSDALRALSRCRPARPPVYRDGDRYTLDPHDADLDLMAFRLGLRPAKAPRLAVVRPEPEPLPGLDVPLGVAELEEAFRGVYLGSNWSAQRLAIAVLEAHGGRMAGAEVVATLDRLATSHTLRSKAADHWHPGSPVTAANGIWTRDPQHTAVYAARQAIRARIAKKRREQASRPDPSVIAANAKAAERRRAAHAAELAALHRVLLRTFPAKDPEVAALIDVNAHELTFYTKGELDRLRQRLVDCDLIGAVDVRAVLAALGVDHKERRLDELGPPQKSRTLNKAGRKLKITVDLLVRGSCGISQPFGEAKKLRAYLAAGETTKLRRRLEADAKSLLALYQYGRLHGALRLHWGFIDERIPAPWHHWDEPTLRTLIHQAHEQACAIEVVIGSAPGWSDPWSRVRRCVVEQSDRYSYTMFDLERGEAIDEWDVQLARLARR